MYKHHSSPYLKMRVLGAIDFAEGKTIQDRIQTVSKMIFTDEEGIPRQFTWRTIQTWKTRYNTHGITSMINKSRSDKGKCRKIEPNELLEAIEQVMPMFRENHVNKMLLYKTCIEKGLIRKEHVSQTSFYRIVNGYNLLKSGDINPKMREAWGKLYANQLWQADSMQGPFVDHNGNKSVTWLIAFIDDASRVLCHGQFYFKNDTNSLIASLQAAIYKRGIPEQMYVDNGSNYISQELTLVCARVGCILCHAPVRDGAAKGKIERFFRTVRENFLIRNLDLSSIESLNKQFVLWLESEYNSKIHSSLQMKPIDRFGLDLKRIKFLPPCDANDELFFMEEERTVKKDNTFSFKNIRFEPPRDFRSKIIQIRYERLNPKHLVVYYKNERMGLARLLNQILNDKFNKEN
ncbi:MAG: integrase catalytic subunit [uncultured bacterium]|nr:MAG: integrase catalytic subunit [uncultured bacterium]